MGVRSWLIDPMEKTKLGKTNLTVSRAGLGVLAIGQNHRALSHEEGSGLLLYGLRRGICFFDTAQYYDQYPLMRSFLEKANDEGYRREDIVISSKSLADGHDEMRDAVTEALEELGTEYIDIFLMHEVRSGQLEERAGAWQALLEAKEAGRVKAIGISTHHADVALRAARLDGCDCVFALLNVEGLGIRTAQEGGPGSKLPGYWIDDRPADRSEMEDALKACRERGLGVFTMKALGGGNLTASYREALDYAFSRPFTDSVMLGMTSEREIDELISYLSGMLPKDFIPDIREKRLKVNHEDCVGCGSCIKACSSQAVSFGEDGLSQIDTDKCIDCGYCAYACPVRAIIRV